VTSRQFLVLALLAAMAPARAACIAESQAHTVALVELYTSEHCARCPVAERWLARLAAGATPERVLPLELHTDYWEYFGSRDSRAERRIANRHGRLSLLQRMALVDRPQVLLQGRDFQPWESRAFDDAVARINARPARARLEVEIRSAAGAFAAGVRAEIDDPAQRADAVLFMAAFERRQQGYLVQEWQGPFAVQGGGRVEERRLALLPGATPEASGVAAFVQNRRTAEVLQAVLLPACSP
jgi:hypothetical protein